MRAMIENLILKNRSYRRFNQNGPVSTETLKDLVNLARLSASAANMQPLKYILSNTPERNEKVFQTLSWAGYLKDWDGPAVGERPSAYIIILGDSEIAANFHCDHGIAAQSIMLGAAEQGLGGCIIGSINKVKLRDLLGIPRHLKVMLVLALGKPNEKIVLEEARDGIKYWRDEKGIHHVPKRKLEDVIVEP
jgi:nitroreductase